MVSSDVIACGPGDVSVAESEGSAGRSVRLASECEDILVENDDVGWELGVVVIRELSDVADDKVVTFDANEVA